MFYVMRASHRKAVCFTLVETWRDLQERNKRDHDHAYFVAAQNQRDRSVEETEHDLVGGGTDLDQSGRNRVCLRMGRLH